MGRFKGQVFLVLLVAVAVLVMAFSAVPASAKTYHKVHEPKEVHKKRCYEAVKNNFNGWVKRVGDYVEKSSKSGPHTKRNLGVVAPRTIVVDQLGHGNFLTVQDAVNSVPTGNTRRVIIQINAGTYRQKIVVPSTKPFITFQGAGMKKTVLVWHDTAGEAGGTGLSASTYVQSAHFIAQDLTFANSAPAPAGGAVGKQAVAFRITGDMAAFYRVAFLGAQDTLYDQTGRHLFAHCFIQGSIDFIFGDGRSLYLDCHLNSIAVPYEGSLTAQNRGSNTDIGGYSFVGCVVTGTGPIYLGRAWGPYSRTVFIRTFFENIIIPAGWYNWGITSRQKTVFYGQYECSGPGANLSGRVPWGRELTSAEASPFSDTRFIDGALWL